MTLFDVKLIVLFIIVYAIVHSIAKKRNNRVKNQNQTSIQNQSITPSNDILETIRLYKEIKNIQMDKNERIRRCNNFLIDFEDYTRISSLSEVGKANWNALWKAVNENDMVYEGDRYSMDMMSNICLSIINQKPKL